MKEELKGVEGWLWFFAFSLTVLTPLFILFGIFSDTTADATYIIFNLIFIAIAITVGSAIFTKKEKAIIWAKELFTAYLIISIFDLIIYFIFPIDFSDDFLSNPFRNVVVSIIWLLYLNNSQRVKNTFKIREVNWKRMTMVIIIAVATYITLILVGFYSAQPDSQTPTILNIPEPITVNGTLLPDYGVYHEFKDQSILSEVRFEFSSDYPIDAYLVPSEGDYDDFMQGNLYNSYQGCSFKNKRFAEINCNVSSGGIIIYNPSSFTAHYEIS